MPLTGHERLVNEEAIHGVSDDVGCGKKETTRPLLGIFYIFL